MARPNQKLVVLLNSIMELGHSAQSLQTALDAASGKEDEEKPAPKRSSRKAPAKKQTASRKKPAAKKQPAKKRQPKKPAVPSFLEELEDADLVDVAAAVLEIDSGKVERVLKRSGREAIYKKLLEESSEEDLETAVDALFEDEEDDGDDDGDDFDDEEDEDGEDDEEEYDDEDDDFEDEEEYEDDGEDDEEEYDDEDDDFDDDFDD